MIVSNEVSDSDQVARGVVRQIPAKWAKFGHEESRFNQEDADVEGTEHMKKKWHHRHEEREEREREHHDHDEDHDDDEHEHEHKGSLRMWAKIGHEGPRFHHEDADVEGTEHMKRKRHHEYREEREREHDDDDDDDDDEEHEHKHKHKGWLRKWARFGHEGPRFHHGYNDEEGREHMKKWHHRHAEREHDHDKHGREDDGWMKSVGKFLGQF